MLSKKRWNMLGKNRSTLQCHKASRQQKRSHVTEGDRAVADCTKSELRRERKWKRTNKRNSQECVRERTIARGKR